MAERVDVSTIETLYPFISLNPTVIPYQKTLTDTLISDKKLLYPNLDWGDATSAVIYTYGLDMKQEDYRNMKVLDAGSGLGGFKRSLKSMGIKADVTNYDDGVMFGGSPYYLVDVQGKVENMPFADDTFDVTVLNWVFPDGFLDGTLNTNFMAAQLRELVRVTKKSGGIIRYSPIRMFRVSFGNEQQTIYDEATRKAFRELEKLHTENPNMIIQITRLVHEQRNGQNQFDDILEITFQPTSNDSIST